VKIFAACADFPGRGIYSASTSQQVSSIAAVSGPDSIRESKRPEGRARALERERAQEGESPSVAELPATN